MPTVQKSSFRDVEIHSFFGPLRRFPVDVLRDVKKLNSKFALVHDRATSKKIDKPFN